MLLVTALVLFALAFGLWASYPSGYNTFVPSRDATGDLVINFSRNPKDFMLNKWATMVPVKKNLGLYLRLTVDECARVLSADLNDVRWPDGNDAPSNVWGNESFANVPYQTFRVCYGFRVGYLAEEQADWKLLSTYSAIKAQQAMTSRTVSAVNRALTTANYATNHVATATVWGGGYLNTGTGINPILRKALLAMAARIHKDTRGVVRAKDLIVVMSPDLARTLAISQEISDYLRGSPFAEAQVRGDKPSLNGFWGMPDMYAGFPLVIEDAVYNANRKGDLTQDGVYAWPFDVLAMFARPGGLTAAEGSMSFSTIHVWMKEEMTVETKDDPDNRRKQGRVVEDFSADVAAPVSGCLCTASLSVAPLFFMADSPEGDRMRRREEENAKNPAFRQPLEAVPMSEAASQHPLVFEAIQRHEERVQKEKARASKADRRRN